MCLFFAAKTDEVLKAKVAKREEEARKKQEEGECYVVCVVVTSTRLTAIKSSWVTTVTKGNKPKF